MLFGEIPDAGQRAARQVRIRAQGGEGAALSLARTAGAGAATSGDVLPIHKRCELGLLCGVTEGGLANDVIAGDFRALQLAKLSSLRLGIGQGVVSIWIFVQDGRGIALDKEIDDAGY